MMLDINLTKENTHIGNSYIIKTKKSMQNEIEYIKLRREARRYPVTRTTNSYVREWKGHNRLYKIGEKLQKNGVLTKLANYLVAHAKDADLDEYIGAKGKLKGIFNELIWLIIGGI